MKGNEPELDEGDVFDTNSGGRDSGPLGVEIPTPPTAPLGVPGGAVVLAPLTALLGGSDGVVGGPAVVAPVLGEHFDGTGMPTHVPGGGVQFVVVVLVHGGGVQFVVVVLVHGGGVQFVVVVLVHGGGVVFTQPVWAGLVLPIPILRSHSYPAL